MTVDKQIPEQARALGISEQEVINVMLEDTVDGEFTTVQDSPRRRCSSPRSTRTR